VSAADSLEIRVLRTLEELLKNGSAGAHRADTSMVLKRMRLGEEHRDELAECMNELIDLGDIQGKPLRGDNKVMDVEVSRITEQGKLRLEDE
jgi:hypothetical protein